MSEKNVEYQGDPRFHALLDDMRDMHIVKSAGYAGIDNPDVFANFRQCEEIGIPAFLGAFIRKMDKDSRLRNLIVNPHNDMIDEGVEDTLFDSASYDLIVKLLFEENKQRNIRFLELLYELNKQLDREFFKRQVDE